MYKHFKQKGFSSHIYKTIDFDSGLAVKYNFERKVLSDDGTGFQKKLTSKIPNFSKDFTRGLRIGSKFFSSL